MQGRPIPDATVTCPVHDPILASCPHAETDARAVPVPTPSWLDDPPSEDRVGGRTLTRADRSTVATAWRCRAGVRTDRASDEGDAPCRRRRRAASPRSPSCPSTIERSGDKAQRTFAKAHDSAAESYGEGQRAYQTAYSALKHTHEKVGDHWEPKEKKGPSDRQAEGGRGTNRKTAGGVDANASKKHLQDVARRLDISGRSRMTKEQLVEAIQKANDRASARSRSS